MFNLGRHAVFVVAWRIGALPGDVALEAVGSEDFVAHEFQRRALVVIDAYKYGAGSPEHHAHQPQPRIHHAQPLVMTREVLSLLADDLTEPFSNPRIVHVVVVNPAFVAGVIRRIAQVGTMDTRTKEK